MNLLKLKPKRNVTRRFVLQAGFSCNARCRFCYYQASLKKGVVQDYTTKEIKTKLRDGKRLGKDMVDISGGEPTIRQDIFEIINYAQQIGYRRICLITNGIKMADETFCDKLINAGMNEVLFSIHSPIEKDHDWLTRIPGSYKKIMYALKYLCTKKEVEIRINSTISSFNYQNLDELFELVKPYYPTEFNILILNPSQEALKGNDEVIIADYLTISPVVSKAINKYEDDFKVINVRWLPFCLLKGHEEKIRTMWQKMYEDKEWDPFLNIKYNRGIVPVIASFLVGCFLYPFKTPKYGKRNFYTLFNEILTTFRGGVYYKHLKECRKCSLKKICPGLHRNYLKKFGGNKTKLIAYKLDKIIEDPLYFCEDYKNNFESLRLSENGT